jgi:hypothetical protein
MADALGLWRARMTSQSLVFVGIAVLVALGAAIGSYYKVQSLLDDAYSDGFYEGIYQGRDEGYVVGNSEAISCVYHKRPRQHDLRDIEETCKRDSVVNPYSLPYIAPPKRL